MTYRLILAPVFGTPGDRAQLRLAAAIAKRFGAALDCLFVAPDPRESVPVMGEGMSGEIVEQLMEAVEGENQGRHGTARGAFAALREAEGARLFDRPEPNAGFSVRWRERTGRVDDIVTQEARMADLVVFGYPEPDAEASLRLALENTLLDGRRPLVVTPGEHGEWVGARPAIAWNGSRESVAAVTLGMPFLAAAEKVTVVTVGTDRTVHSQANRLIDHLTWHGIDADVHTVQREGKPVGAVIEQAAVDCGADLLVCGGYGHTRLRELILGGVTRHLLDNPRLPLLLAH